MCLAIPGKVIEISDSGAKVSIEGLVVDADTALSEKIEVGDYVIVHAGFILQKMSPQEAAEELDTIRTYAADPEQM